jgi:integrase
VVAWAAEVRKKVSAAHTRHALLVLSQLLKLAVRDGRLGRNPADGVTKPRVPRPEQRFLSHEELSRLAVECQPPYDLLVLLLGFTGLRFGEVAALRVRDVDVARGRLNVAWNLVEVSGGLHRDTPESHKRRSVPFPAFLRGSMDAHMARRGPDDPLFTSSRGCPLRNSNFRHYVFDPAVKRAALSPLTPHDLRDTAASLAVASGASVKSVQRMLGHASAAMTLDVYAGLFDAELDDVADRMNDAAGDVFKSWAARNDPGPEHD